VRFLLSEFTQTECSTSSCHFIVRCMCCGRGIRPGLLDADPFICRPIASLRPYYLLQQQQRWYHAVALHSSGREEVLVCLVSRHRVTMLQGDSSILMPSKPQTHFRLVNEFTNPLTSSVAKSLNVYGLCGRAGSSLKSWRTWRFRTRVQSAGERVSRPSYPWRLELPRGERFQGGSSRARLKEGPRLHHPRPRRVPMPAEAMKIRRL
jgi:hypothetical protein